MQKTIYLLDVVGAIGDSLCCEPIVRYAIRNKPDADIRILTNHPHLFRHLNRPMGVTLDELKINANDPFLNLVHLPNRHEIATENGIQYHPFVQWASPQLIPAMDFASILMLKRTLPDADKRIHIEFEDTTQKIEALTGCRLEDLVVLHAGTGAPEKTRLFPENYINGLIDEMVREGLKVAVIATTDHRSHATEVTSPNAINLIDKLKWNDFCTIISKAKVLVTNDSSPVHLASMFDNWLIVLPTVKHPDRLIHVRNGNRYYKSIALYQKLMCDDATEFPFDRCMVSCDWTGIDAVRDNYLPDVKIVAKHAAQAASGTRSLIGGINPNPE